MEKILIVLLLALFAKLSFGEEVFLSITREGVAEEFLPSNTVVLTKEDIERVNARNVGEVLDNLTTGDISHYGTLGSLKTLRLRNSTADQVLILLNGVPISGSGKGAIDLSLIPAESIERIEIIQGSCSALYGANAVAGVVNIITKKEVEKEFQIAPKFSYSSFETYIFNAEAGYNNSQKGFSAVFSAVARHSDGWRKNSKCDSSGGYVNFSLPLSFGKFTLDALVGYSWVGVPGPTTIPMKNWDGEKERAASTPFAAQYDNLQFVSLGFERGFLASKVSYNRQQLQYDNSKALWPEQTDSVLETASFLNTFSLPYDFSVSLNFEWTQIDQKYPLRQEYNFRKDVSNLGIALQKEINFGAFNIIPTIRWDSSSLFKDRLSPQVILTYNFSNTKISFSGGTSWRAPTLLDLYWPNQVWAKGNTALQPEESYSADFGIERSFKNVVVKANPFFRYIKGQIRWYPEDQKNPWSAWMPSNVDEAVAEGVELSCDVALFARWRNKLSILISDNRIKKKGEEDKGWQKQAYSPLASLVYYSILSLPYDIDVVNNIKSSKSQYSLDNEAGTKLPTYVLWNLRVEKRILSIGSVYFQVNDLLNQKGVNRDGYPQPGRNYEIGINAKLSF